MKCFGHNCNPPSHWDYTSFLDPDFPNVIIMASFVVAVLMVVGSRFGGGGGGGGGGGYPSQASSLWLRRA